MKAEAPSGLLDVHNTAMSLSSKCPLCMTDTYYRDDVKTYYGDPCGHCFCSECSSKVGRANSGISGTNSNVCPVCHNYVRFIQDYEYEEAEFIRHENTFRKLVYSIMNETRNDFKDTPCYDNYLEKREDYIHKLIYGDENERKATQEYLNKYSKENQISIFERKTRDETRLKNSIIEIVGQEGTFYEQLNQLSQNSHVDHLQIVHPLQTEYPEFFQNYQTKKEGKDEDSTTNNSAAGVHILGRNVPNPVDASITSRDQIQRKTNFNTETAQRAGGFTENIVWNLCKDELFYGFYGRASCYKS